MNNFLSRVGERLTKKGTRPFQLIQIESSLACSLDCIMCPWTELRAQGGVMSWETFRNIIPSLSLAKNVDLTGGGEPLTNPNLVEMVRRAKSAGCQVGFSTNGKGLAPEISKEMLDSDIDWISFSVDAATPEKYERIRQGAKFSAIIQNIRGLRDLKCSLGREKPELMMVFVAMGGEAGECNYPELPAYVELAKELGVGQVIVKNLDVILNAEDDQRRLFQHEGTPDGVIEETILLAKARADQVGIKLRHYLLQPQEQPVCEHNPVASLFINWEGWVSPCITQAYAGERLFAGERVMAGCQRFGNINRMPLEEIWNLPAYRDFQQKFVRRQQAGRQFLIDAFTDNRANPSAALPPPPAGCESCYYLYGI